MQPETSQAANVVVVGSLHYDILVHTSDRPRKGETVQGHAWEPKCGGKGGNQAVEAARHGGAVAFVGAVGNDGFGATLRANLQAGGVAVDTVRTIADTGSGMSVALIDDDGDYGAVIVPGSNWRIGAADVATATVLDTARVLLLQNEVREQVNLLAASKAKAGGATVVWNAAPARPADPALLAVVDIVVVNEIEAEMMGGGEVRDLTSAARAATALADGERQVIVTAGGFGCALATADGTLLELPAHQVEVASTHGAGDAFAGALAARLATGAELARAVTYANVAAAILVRTPEAQRSRLTAADTLRLLDGV
ncbi:MAG: PfkB family carbohydrate kinase [Pseudomonadota bacterium]